ncbi:thiamine phosphate synthase [Thioclava sediminum]|jgi:thiamine-phosphate pyrophosphorylase|uniref:Thiamine phosphate synthase n=2 Tax=Thioclava TaxID=285107 RepID=A0ABX6YW47_9RHOB|nr:MULTISPECIES: thiamine phosphate synthase [Thioclava]MPQ93953.1 thiamine phosphate synthase [Thioclava sp. JE_KL1]OOY05112.1 thiamine phosphate synthase [Thioclava sp. F28-4]OOY08737.1 thiamine phosphate synthase [Thioclava sp. F36-7]OOY23625.1 thiamine phosphate synthase [Thioclava sediminum]QPZ91395.1 thiamine phosphate synthase [Thioclava electrotropha]
MAEDRPQIYLITPPAFDAEEFAPKLASVLDAHDIACIRLSLASRDEYEIGRIADAMREVAHARDVALVIESHVALVERHGLDGVHFTDGAKQIRYGRKELGDDAIVGSYCGNSRHEGMNAGEAGADYVCFGPIGETNLGTAEPAEHELFAWWSEVIEVPVVAEGALTEELVTKFAPVTDWFAFGDEVWREDDPAAALGRFIKAMS